MLLYYNYPITGGLLIGLVWTHCGFIQHHAGHLGFTGNIKLASLIEMSIGAAVGAITFSGSVIAFLKLQGIMSGAPITFKGQH